MKRKMTISLLCSEFKNLEEVIHIAEKTKIDYLHIDVMDGKFVPNFGLGLDYIRQIRAMTSIPLDFHLMVYDPEPIFSWLNLTEKDIVSFHYEGCKDLKHTLEVLSHYPCKKLLAINPETSIDVVKENITFLDGATILLVNPGFIGQPTVEGTEEKVKELRDWMTQQGHLSMEIEVDGSVSYQRAELLKEYGATLYVNGTSSIFGDSIAYLESNIARFQKILGES